MPIIPQKGWNWLQKKQIYRNQRDPNEGVKDEEAQEPFSWNMIVGKQHRCARSSNTPQAG